MWWLDRLPSFVTKSRILAIHTFIDIGSLKIVQSFLQIIYMMTLTINVEYPAPYSQIIDLLASYSDESSLLSDTCNTDLASNYQFVSDQKYYANAISSNAMLFLVCFVVSGVGWLRIRCFCSNVQTNEHERSADTIRLQHYFVVFMIIWNFLPIVVWRLSKTFDCVEIYQGYNVIRVDTTIACDNTFFDADNGARNVVSASLCFCLVVPLVLWFNLWKLRKRLNPSLTQKDDLSMALFLRNRDRKIKPYFFLFSEYKPQHYWFECFLFYQRFALSSLLVFVRPPARAAGNTPSPNVVCPR
jgi:hypothetical protein